MRKTLLTCGTLLLAAVAQKAAAQAFTENFNSVTTAGQVPAGWVMINDGNTVSSTFANSATIAASLTANAFVPLQLATGNYGMLTTSLFNPAATANRWLITKSFTVSANMIFSWQDWDLNSGEKIQVLLSPTAGTTAAAFTVPLYNAAAGSGGFVTHYLPLGSYSGQTVRLAFRDNNAAATTNWGFVLDNVSAVVAPNADGAITQVSPIQDDLNANVVAGTTVAFSGYLANLGYNAVTSYSVKYQVNGGAVQSQTITGNIASYTVGGQFSFNVTAPSSPGRYPVKIWISVAGDTNPANDTFSTAITVHGTTNLPHKTLTFEEGTGTWCGYCVRGIVYMDSMEKVNRGAASLIAVHNSQQGAPDPMLVTNYDALITSLPGFTGFPTIVLDRRILDDPSNIFSLYSAHQNDYAFASVKMTKVTYSGSTVSVNVTVTPAENMVGDYRLALVLTEERVHGTGAGWDQHNYYGVGGSANSTVLKNSEYNFNTLPTDIPATTMYYDHVARIISPSPTGAAGSLPAAMTAGTTYTATLTATVDASWNKANIIGVVELIAQSNGNILNSATSGWTLDVANLKAGVNNLVVYPNPANSTATVKVDLNDATSMGIDVIDMAGRTVYSIAPSQKAAGVTEVNIPVGNLAAGIYNVRVQTANGTATERLSVVK